MSNTQKDPKDWVSGDDPMTGAQESYLKTLANRTTSAPRNPKPRPKLRNSSTSCGKKPDWKNASLQRKLFTRRIDASVFS
jgi:hypothetical protein